MIESEKLDLFRAVVETAHHAIAVIESGAAGQRIIDVNAAFVRITGYPPGEVLGRSLRQLQEFGAGEQVWHRIGAAMSTYAPARIEVLNTRKDGSEYWAELEMTPLPQSPGANKYWSVVLRDISERKRTENLVRASEERLTGILRSARDAVITIDGDQNIILFNPAAEQIFGVAAAEAIGGPLDRFLPERYRIAHAVQIRRFGETGVASRQMGAVSRLTALRSGGEEFPIEASISQATIDGAKLYTAIIRDVTEKERSESRIREQSELLNKVTNAIIVFDSDDRIVFWNQGAERLYGWTAQEAVGRRNTELFRGTGPDTGPKAAERAEAGSWSGELKERTKDGRTIIVESHWTALRDENGRPRGTIVVSIDVTDKSELETRFLRAQRLESVGTLVSGIAHDLNNVLTPILMAVRLLKRDKPGIDKSALLDSAAASVERGTAMIRQLLAFAGGPEGERAPVALSAVVAEVRGMLAHSLPKSITIETEVPADLWPVTGDATQLSQVLMNLCVNARDAMPHGGALRITAANKSFGREIIKLFPDSKPGPYVVLSVDDTGTGIPHGVLERIFDPFFTTKPFGMGSGLGLSTVLGIVKSHGGFVNVYSEVGHGTRFTSYLPANAGPAAAGTETPAEGKWEGHGETILIVDDEPLIVLTVKATLESSGYRVLTANGGTAALDLYRVRHQEIDAVITDMMMPGMDGPALIEELQKIRSDLKIIAASGLRLSERSAVALAAGAIAFLKKPFSDDELLQTLSQHLHKAVRPVH